MQERTDFQRNKAIGAVPFLGMNDSLYFLDVSELLETRERPGASQPRPRQVPALKTQVPYGFS